MRADDEQKLKSRRSLHFGRCLKPARLDFSRRSSGSPVDGEEALSRLLARARGRGSDGGDGGENAQMLSAPTRRALGRRTRRARALATRVNSSRAGRPTDRRRFFALHSPARARFHASPFALGLFSKKKAVVRAHVEIF